MFWRKKVKTHKRLNKNAFIVLVFHLTQMKQCTSLGQIIPWWATNRLTAAWLESNEKCERIDNIYPLMLSDFCQVVWLGVAVTNNEHGHFLPRTLIPVYTWCWVVVNDCDSPHPTPPRPPAPTTKITLDQNHIGRYVSLRSYGTPLYRMQPPFVQFIVLCVYRTKRLFCQKNVILFVHFLARFIVCTLA